MNDPIEIFFAAWSVEDATKRQEMITEAVAQNAIYADPRTPAPLTGPAALAEYVGMFATSAPGAIAEVSNVDTRDGVSRATIAFKMANGMEQAGQYFVEHNADGVISRMVGFVGTGA